MKTALYSFFLFLFPLFVLANVVINEIAWMGTVNSASDEWIELYSLDSIDLTGWHLITEDGAVDIALSGSITAGGFFLIERTDDTTVPNIPADFVTPFGSGLSNSGEILTLKNAEGAVVDRIDASSGWPAGDNTTKETMQKSGPPAGGGWITAAATPKAVNVSTSTSTDSTDNSSAGGGDASYVQPENLPRIKANAGEDQQAAVGEQIQFHGNAWGLENELLENARYAWNFGDGTIYEGRNVGHAYMFPGTYTVRVTVSSGKYSAFDDLHVGVEENTVMASEVLPGETGWIEFQNNGSKPIHIGGWIVEIEGSRFIIPLGTTIASRSFAVLSAATTRLFLKQEGDHVYLFYPNGTYASGISYVFQVPRGSSISNNAGASVFTDPTPGKPNHIEQLSIAAPEPVQPHVPLAHASKVSFAPQKQKVLQDSVITKIKPAENAGKVIEQNIPVQAATVADVPLFSKTYRETLWFGSSLIAGGLAAVGMVLVRRRMFSKNNTD